MRILNTVARHVVVLLFALSVAALLNMLASEDRFLLLAVPLAIICLTIFHRRWLLKT